MSTRLGICVGGAALFMWFLARQSRRRARPLKQADTPGDTFSEENAAPPIKVGPTLPIGGFHRRQLPAPAIALSSTEGRAMLKTAMAESSMEIFFRLAEAFHTQAEPAFCGLGTLVVVLNALEVDPGEIMVGPWRWYSESMLDCCVELEEVRERGLTFDEWSCLARCQGLVVDAVQAEESTLEAFRASVVGVCARMDAVVCVTYSRKPLGQAGDGHFSPIGGYHAPCAPHAGPAPPVALLR